MRKLVIGVISLLVMGLCSLAVVAVGPAVLEFEPISAEMVKEVETDFSGMKLENGFVVVLKVNASADSRIWMNDIGLAYLEDGEEFRFFCQAMTTPVSSPEDEGGWKYDPFGSVRVKKGSRYFKAFFPLQAISLTNVNLREFEAGEQLDLYVFVREPAKAPLSVTAIQLYETYDDEYDEEGNSELGW